MLWATGCWAVACAICVVGSPEAPFVTAPKGRGAVNTSGILREEFPLGLDVIGDLVGAQGLVVLLQFSCGRFCCRDAIRIFPLNCCGD